MLMLLVCTSDYTYAISSSQITEIIPRVKIKKIPLVPEYLVGQINFNGKPVPIADLSILVEGKPASLNMHTRIVLLQPQHEKRTTFGIMAENVTETIDLKKEDFQESGLHPKKLPFFNGIFNEGAVSVQMIDVDKLYEFLGLEIIS